MGPHLPAVGNLPHSMTPGDGNTLEQSKKVEAEMRVLRVLGSMVTVFTTVFVGAM